MAVSTSPLHVVRVRQVEGVTQAAVGKSIGTFDDTVLASFLEKQLPAIAGEAVTPLRFTTTDSPNSLFVEYETKAVERHRILLTVRDVIHTEWVIRARYELVNATWRKVEGGGLADPQPVRLYEWESEVKKWILKHSTKN